MKALAIKGQIKDLLALLVIFENSFNLHSPKSLAILIEFSNITGRVNVIALAFIDLTLYTRSGLKCKTKRWNDKFRTVQFNGQDVTC